MGKTSKVFSLMSYNSPEFLDELLRKYYDNHLIRFYAFIEHIGEYDELSDTTDKDHIHVFIEPNEGIDPMELIDQSNEYVMLDKSTGEILPCPKDDNGKDLPWKCLGFRFSDWENWLFYNLHCTWYLQMKNETREYYDYDPQSMHVPDRKDYDCRYYMAFHFSKEYKQYRILNALSSGQDAVDLIMRGNVPIAQTTQFLALEKLRQKSINDDELLQRVVESRARELLQGGGSIV